MENSYFDEFRSNRVQSNSRVEHEVSSEEQLTVGICFVLNGAPQGNEEAALPILLK